MLLFALDHESITLLCCYCPLDGGPVSEWRLQHKPVHERQKHWAHILHGYCNDLAIIIQILAGKRTDQLIIFLLQTIGNETKRYLEKHSLYQCFCKMCIHVGGATNGSDFFSVEAQGWGQCIQFAEEEGSVQGQISTRLFSEKLA